jgi:hypothetical protein
MSQTNGNGNSILDKIISNHKAQEVASLDAIEIINNLFGELSERERDVLVRRYGLHGAGKETLENIGSIHKLTRERIRQIETASIKKLRQLERLEEYISILKKVIWQLLEEHGGMMEREYLLNVLVNFSVGEWRARTEDKLIHKLYLDFLISKLLHNDFELVTGSKYFKHIYKLKYETLEHYEEILEDLLARLATREKTMTTEELIGLFWELQSVKKHEQKIKVPGTIDLANVLKQEFFEENRDLVNRH